MSRASHIMVLTSRIESEPFSRREHAGPSSRPRLPNTRLTVTSTSRSPAMLSLLCWDDRPRVGCTDLYRRVGNVSGQPLRRVDRVDRILKILDGYLSLSGFSFGRIRIDARRTGYFVSFAAYTSRGVCVLSSPDQARRSIFLRKNVLVIPQRGHLSVLGGPGIQRITVSICRTPHGYRLR